MAYIDTQCMIQHCQFTKCAALNPGMIWYHLQRRKIYAILDCFISINPHISTSVSDKPSKLYSQTLALVRCKHITSALFPALLADQTLQHGCRHCFYRRSISGLISSQNLNRPEIPHLPSTFHLVTSMPHAFRVHVRLFVLCSHGVA